MKTFILIMHLMVFDPDINMMRGLTFFEPDIPRYNSKSKCIEQGTKIISEAINNFKKLELKTGEWEISCIEVKGEQAKVANGL